MKKCMKRSGAAIPRAACRTAEQPTSPPYFFRPWCSEGMSHAPAPPSPPPVRPVVERVRDNAIAVGTTGAVIGMCIAARHNAPLLSAGVATGGGAAAASAAFISLRHALIQDKWELDCEPVSGAAAFVIGMSVTSVTRGIQPGVRVGVASFVGASAMHYAHRWWLHQRLRLGWC